MAECIATGPVMMEQAPRGLKTRAGGTHTPATHTDTLINLLRATMKETIESGTCTCVWHVRVGMAECIVYDMHFV